MAKALRELISEAEKNKVAIGHFNVSETVALKGILQASFEISKSRNILTPVIIGVSEGEREFFGVNEIAAVVRSLREKFDYPIFLNADHTRSLEKAKEAAQAGFDAILFDPFGGAQGRAGNSSFEENIKKTKEAVQIIKHINPDILVEGELGYIGSSSTIFESVPEGAVIKEEDMTTPEQAARFVGETKVDLIGPAVGNIHGMFKDAPNPHLNIERIKQIKEASGVPLVLHGGSGITDEDFLLAINAGISIIHINTEIRLAWRKGLDKAISENKDEIVPYKLLESVVEEVKKVVEYKLKLFNKIA